MTQLTLEPLDGLSAAREEWTALAEQAGNLFATWEWADAWWRVYGADQKLAITGCRDSSGRLVAILPLYLSRRGPVRMLRFLGHGPADQLGPACAAEDRRATAEALKRLLEERRHGGEHRVLEKALQREIDAEDLADAGEQTRRQERVPPEVEEVAAAAPEEAPKDTKAAAEPVVEEKPKDPTPTPAPAAKAAAPVAMPAGPPKPAAPRTWASLAASAASAPSAS